MNKKLWEIVGSGKLTGSVLKETMAVSDTILISVQNRHSRILLRDLLRGKTEVPEAKVPVEECFDCPARIASKELAPIHSVKNGISQNACSSSPRVDAGFGEKCSYAHRQVDEQPSKRSSKNGDKSAVVFFQKCPTIGLRISRYGAAEVYNDFSEELKHTEANPMCSIH